MTINDDECLTYSSSLLTKENFPKQAIPKEKKQT